MKNNNVKKQLYLLASVLIFLCAVSVSASWSISSPFTTVGFVSGIAAGTHTLTSQYIRVNTANAPIICYVTNNPYFVEIEEIP